METEILVAVTAVVISVVSLVFSVLYSRKTLKITIDHNKLSLAPQITFHHKTYSNLELTQTLDIENKGVGPAIIQSVRYYYLGQVYSEISTIYKEHFPEVFDNIDRNKSYNKIGLDRYSLAQNDSIRAFSMSFLEDYDQSKLYNFLKEVTIEIKYKSIYEDLMIFRVTIISNT